jgi:hypothetical protein
LSHPFVFDDPRQGKRPIYAPFRIGRRVSTEQQGEGKILKLFALFYFVGALSSYTLTRVLSQDEIQFLNNLEHVFRDKEPEWDVSKVVFPPGLPPEHLENGAPLLSPRGKRRFYKLASYPWVGSISIFSGVSKRDAANQFAWLMRTTSRKGEGTSDPIDEQAVQIVGKGTAAILSRKDNICLSVRIELADFKREEQSSKIDSKTAEALEIATRFANHIIELSQNK